MILSGKFAAGCESASIDWPHTEINDQNVAEDARTRAGRAGNAVSCKILNTVSDRPEPEYLQPPVRADGPNLPRGSRPGMGGAVCPEEKRIRTALGQRAILIEHVGSTSVPELAAKPVIDIVLVVADSANESSYLPDLETAGYELQFREPDLDEHRLLRDHNPDVQVHVFTAGNPEVERMLVFRNRLRAIPQDRDLYQRTKRELADRRWDYIQDYADAKSSVVEEIIARAQADQHAGSA